MSIVLRVGCDAPDCGRHLNIPALEMRPRAGLRIGAGEHARESVVFSEPYVPLGKGWRATGPDGAVRVYCADHAEAMS